ncbi:hypothetical protein G7085_12525 [Tessaracoccus sp. HDW20]|uniref:hypothetical protein n=1 Tax=Tessaracoccus coleopterorum TaxID=2714950 RepID=UPI0018D2FE82|nr:hypothetical protein [Tessaracoccus coleopterorum]NHB85170.1 hypothetical protein [Tessaracoccus coleopterorum]
MTDFAVEYGVLADYGSAMGRLTAQGSAELRAARVDSPATAMSGALHRQRQGCCSHATRPPPVASVTTSPRIRPSSWNPPSRIVRPRPPASG